MTPVDQEFLHDKENGIYGDCQRAVIASLLDLPISEVPHFLKEANGDAYDFFTRLQDFVNSHGYVLATSRGKPLLVYCGNDLPYYHEIAGMSPRGVMHAVVGCNGKVVHDPHPSKAGLIGDPSAWEYGYLLKIG